MDNKQDILELLRKVAGGKVSPEDAMLDLKEAPFEDLIMPRLNFHRSVRQGAAEVIYGAGKTPEQIQGDCMHDGRKRVQEYPGDPDRSGGGRLLKRDDPDRLSRYSQTWNCISRGAEKTGTYRGGYRRDQ